MCYYSILLLVFIIYYIYDDFFISIYDYDTHHSLVYFPLLCWYSINK